MWKEPQNLRVVIGSLNMGGAERHLAMVLPALAQRGWDIRVVTSVVENAFGPALEKQGVRVISLPKWAHFSYLPRFLQRALRLTMNFFRLAKEFWTDSKTLTHFFLPETYVMGMGAAKVVRARGVKIMSRRSLRLYQKRRKVLGWLEPFCHRRTDVILGNSQRVVDELREEGIPSEKLRLIYNGIDLSPFEHPRPKAEVRRELGLPESSFVMAIVANLIPYKGHEDLLRALERIQKDLPQPWHLLCVGRDDGILEHLKELASDLGLEDHIRWLGLRMDAADLLCASDLGLLCSHEEGFSNAILEGMAAGLPMVVTDVGGNGEAVLEGKTGYVVSARDPGALSRGILALAGDPKVRKKFGEAGRHRVETHFSLNKCVEAYIELYDRVKPKAMAS